MVSEYQILALLEKLERKIKLLKSASDIAHRRVKELEETNATLRNRLQETQIALNEFREKHVYSEKNTVNPKVVGILVKDNPSDTDTNAELKQQLDEYIQELERCIAHLSSLS